MIISASRRTDIPAFHADWMMRRISEGYALVRNPFNAHQVSRVSLKREDAELIVFWTKDAHNMLCHLPRLDDMGYRYLFQYTLTPYGKDIEQCVDKRQALEALTALSEHAGKERIIWRYDPILFTEEWTAEKHLRMFDRMSRLLEGAAGRCVISFVDLYRGVKQAYPWIHAPGEEDMRLLAREIAALARNRGMIPSACAEVMDFTGEGLENRACIDRADVEAVLECPVESVKDAGQRSACRCMKSVDIGAYDTCRHGCIYCYARTGRRMDAFCEPSSPILGDPLTENDRITDRREKKIRKEQDSFLDW